jgi:hypothetical protein
MRREQWVVDVDEDEVAVLNLPAVLDVDRVAEIDVRLQVSWADLPAQEPHYALSVDLDGVHEWTRRVDHHPAAPGDSIDYHCSRSLPIGQGLRIRAHALLAGGARCRRLCIEAEVEDA